MDHRSSIKLACVRYAYDVRVQFAQTPTSEHRDHVFGVARRVLADVTPEERDHIRVVILRDLCCLAPESELLENVCNVVAARMLLCARVSADPEQCIGGMSAGAALMMLGMTPLCGALRRIMCTLDEQIVELMRPFVDCGEVGSSASLVELAADVARIVSIVADSQSVFLPKK